MNYCSWMFLINGQRMSFDELAVAIGHKLQLMGRRVGSAWKYYEEQKDCGACSVIAAAFYPKGNPSGT